MLRFAFIKSFFYISALLPLRVNHVIGSIIGRIYHLFPSRQKKVSSTNLKLCFPELSDAEHSRLCKKTLIESGKTLTETGPMWLWHKKKIQSLIASTSGEQQFDEAVHCGKGVILAIPHLGSWELVGQYISSRAPMTTLYKPPHLQQLDQYISKARQRFGARLFPTTTSGVRHLYKTLGKGQLVTVLPDQEPGADNGLFAPFFNIQTLTMTLLSRMAHKYQAPVFITYAQRLENARGYKLHFIQANKKVREGVLSESLTSLNKDIEDCIRLIPEQYQWGYKRFKSRPEGEKRFY